MSPRISRLAAVGVLLSGAAVADDTTPNDADSTWQIGDRDVALPPHPAGAAVVSVESIAGSELVHVSFAPVSDAPDARSEAWLFDPAAGAPFTNWSEREPTRIRLLDIDGDGDDDFVRDLDRPAPCGLFVWWEPALLRDGEFTPVSVTPRTTGTPAVGDVAPRRPSVQSELVASSGEHAGLVNALVDGDPTTTWMAQRDGAGTWVALEAPLGARVGGVRLAADDGDGPLVVRARFGDGTEATLAADRSLREYPIATESRCVVVEAAGLGGRERMTLTEASLVTSTDGLSPDAVVREFWHPALEATCASDDHPAAALGVAGRAARADAAALGALLTSVDDPCVARAIVRALASSDEDGRMRLAASVTSVAATEAQAGEYGPDAIGRLAQLRLGDSGWSDALRAAAARSEAPLTLTDFLIAAAADGALIDDALTLASTATVVDLATLVDGADDVAHWQRALRISHRFEAPCDDSSVESLRVALAHDNGTVARLALHAIGARRCGALHAEVESLATDDPSPQLRRSALLALEALGMEICNLRLDDAPDVRAAQAEARCAPSWLAGDPSRLPNVLDGETWPEVRGAWLRSAIAADDEDVDATVMALLIDGATDDDVVATFGALRVRGTAIPTEAIDVMMARDTSRAVVGAGVALLALVEDLPVLWLESLPSAAGYSEQLQPAVDALLAR